MPASRPLEERLQEKISTEPNTGCWLWMGAIVDGYGRVGVYREGTKYAHRVSYESEYGAIPNGMELDHKCRERSCVNPRHLALVNSVENVFAPGSQSIGNLNRLKTHCKRGHELTSENIWNPPNAPQSRQCRECLRIRANKGYHRRRKR